MARGVCEAGRAPATSHQAGAGRLEEALAAQPLCCPHQVRRWLGSPRGSRCWLHTGQTHKAMRPRWGPRQSPRHAPRTSRVPPGSWGAPGGRPRTLDDGTLLLLEGGPGGRPGQQQLLLVKQAIQQVLLPAAVVDFQESQDGEGQPGQPGGPEAKLQ